MNDCFKIRVGVVIFDQENRLLLVRQNKKPFWVLPGGTLEKGETIAQCAIREIKEEANLDIKLGPMLYVGDFFASTEKQVLDIIFYGYLDKTGVVQQENTENIDEIRFVNRHEVDLSTLKPEKIFKMIFEFWNTQQLHIQTGVYIGAYQD